MRKLFFIAFLTLTASVYGVDWEANGYKVMETQKNSSDVTTVILKNIDDQVITVTYTDDIEDKDIGIIKKLHSDFKNWTSLKLDSINFSVINDEINISVKPKEYSYNDVNFMDYISTGILFSYRGNLVYNFRIMVDNLFVPIKGVFTDEVSFNEKILSAIKDPKTYINARDPDYLLEKLDKLSVDFERLRAYALAEQNYNKPIEKEIINEVLKIRSEKPDISSKDIYKIMKDKDIKTSEREIKAILKVYFNEF